MKASHSAHDSEDIVIDRKYLDIAQAVAVVYGLRIIRNVLGIDHTVIDLLEGQLQSRVVNARKVACAGWLVLLWLQGKRIHVDTGSRHGLAALVWLHLVVISSLALRHAVMAVELQLCREHRGIGVINVAALAGEVILPQLVEFLLLLGSLGAASAVLDFSVLVHGVNGSRDICIAPALALQQRQGFSAVQAILGHFHVGQVFSPWEWVRVVVDSVLVALYDPCQVLDWVVEVQANVLLDLGAAQLDRLIASELQLLDQQFVVAAGKNLALLGIQVYVVSIQGRVQLRRRAGAGAGAGAILGPDAVDLSVLGKVEVNLHVVELQGNQRQRHARLLVEEEQQGQVHAALDWAADDLVLVWEVGHAEVSVLLGASAEQLVVDAEPVAVVAVNLLTTNLQLHFLDQRLDWEPGSAVGLHNNLQVHVGQEVAIAANGARDALAIAHLAVESLLD